MLWLPAGPALARALADLPASGPCPLPHDEDRLLHLPTPGHSPGWPCACQVVMAAAWEACATWATANASRALVDAAGPQPVEVDVAGGQLQLHDPARDELAHALRWTVNATGTRIAAARSLVGHPDLLALVDSATISAWAARLVTDHLADLDPDQAASVIGTVSTRAQARLDDGRRPYNSAEINRIARAARLRVCPESERQARVRAFAGRRVFVHRQADGMATLIADLAESDAHRIHRRLSALAQGLASDAAADGLPDPRTRDQMRADVLVDLVLDGSGVGQAASAGRGRPDIQVIVTLETLLGPAGGPAEVPGLGPIPASVARELAADGRWTAWIVDASGAVTATGSRGYVPTEAVARLVRAREPRCRFPGCRQPATRCDLDHTVPWPRGSTTPENLGPLCRRHHQLKTHGGWDLAPSTGPRDSPTRVRPAEPGSIAHPDPMSAGPDPTSAHPDPTSAGPDPTARAAPTSGPTATGSPPRTEWRWRSPAGFAITEAADPPLP